MFFNKRLRKLKMRRMYMPSDKLGRVRKTRLLTQKLNTVPQTPPSAVLTELRPKGE